MSRDLPPTQALERMSTRTGWYDPAFLDGLASLVGRPVTLVGRTVAVGILTSGMVMAENLYIDTGVLLLKQGVAISEPIRLRLEIMAAGGSVPKQVRVLVPPEDAEVGR